MAKLANRVFKVITKNAEEGAIRSHIMRRLNCSRDALDDALAVLVTSGAIYQMQDPRPKRGAAPYRYYLPKYKTWADAKHLTKVETPFMVPLEPKTESPPTVRTCVQCGRRLPEHIGRGRPIIYCSEKCKIAASEDPGLRKFLDRTMDGPTQAKVCFYIVAADLVLRGFHVAVPFGVTGVNTLLAYDDVGHAAQIRIYMIDSSGIVPDVSYVDSAVIMYLDGHIEYAGQNPLVPAVTDDIVEEEYVPPVEDPVADESRASHIVDSMMDLDPDPCESEDSDPAEGVDMGFGDQ